MKNLDISSFLKPFESFQIRVKNGVLKFDNNSWRKIKTTKRKKEKDDLARDSQISFIRWPHPLQKQLTPTVCKVNAAGGLARGWALSYWATMRYISLWPVGFCISQIYRPFHRFRHLRL